MKKVNLYAWVNPEYAKNKKSKKTKVTTNVLTDKTCRDGNVLYIKLLEEKVREMSRKNTYLTDSFRKRQVNHDFTQTVLKNEIQRYRTESQSFNYFVNDMRMKYENEIFQVKQENNYLRAQSETMMNQQFQDTGMKYENEIFQVKQENNYLRAQVGTMMGQQFQSNVESKIETAEITTQTENEQVSRKKERAEISTQTNDDYGKFTLKVGIKSETASLKKELNDLKMKRKKEILAFTHEEGLLVGEVEDMKRQLKDRDEIIRLSIKVHESKKGTAEISTQTNGDNEKFSMKVGIETASLKKELNYLKMKRKKEILAFTHEEGLLVGEVEAMKHQMKKLRIDYDEKEKLKADLLDEQETRKMVENKANDNFCMIKKELDETNKRLKGNSEQLKEAMNLKENYYVNMVRLCEEKNKLEGDLVEEQSTTKMIKTEAQTRINGLLDQIDACEERVQSKMKLLKTASKLLYKLEEFSDNQSELIQQLKDKKEEMNNSMIKHNDEEDDDEEREAKKIKEHNARAYMAYKRKVDTNAVMRRIPHVNK